MRENAATKARRLLTEGRVTVLIRDRVHLEAVVRGDSGIEHRVAHDFTAGWTCDCEATAFKSSCSHVQALQLIVLLNRRQQP